LPFGLSLVTTKYVHHFNLFHTNIIFPPISPLPFIHYITFSSTHTTNTTFFHLSFIFSEVVHKKILKNKKIHSLKKNKPENIFDFSLAFVVSRYMTSINLFFNRLNVCTSSLNENILVTEEITTSEISDERDSMDNVLG